MIISGITSLIFINIAFYFELLTLVTRVNNEGVE